LLLWLSLSMLVQENVFIRISLKENLYKIFVIGIEMGIDNA